MTEDNSTPRDEENSAPDAHTPFAAPAPGAPAGPNVPPAPVPPPAPYAMVPGTPPPPFPTDGAPFVHDPFAPQGAPQKPRGSGTLSVIALVLALLALLLSPLGLYAFFSWLFGLPAFIIAIVALVKKSSKRGSAIAALIVSVVAFLVSLVAIIIGLVALAETEDDYVIPASDWPLPSTTDDVADALPEAGTEAGETTSDGLMVVETAVVERDGRWEYVAIIENTTTDYMWSFARFQVEAFDSDGVLLDSRPSYVTILPGQTVALEGSFSGTSYNAIDSLQVRMDHDREYVGSDEQGAFEFSEPEYENLEFYTDITGTITSTFAEDQEFISVVAVVRDAAGEVVEVERDVLTRMPADGAARFEMTLYDFPIDDSMSIEFYVTP